MAIELLDLSKIHNMINDKTEYADDRTDISGYNKCNYFLCIVLLYVRMHNDLWKTYYEFSDQD